MKKNVVLIIVGLAVLFIVILLAFFINDKQLDLKSEEVTKLYSYLGEIDIYHCGGLNQYSKETTSYEDLSNENKMCIAYYALDNNKISNLKANVTTTSKENVNICEIGEGIRLITEEGEECAYQTIAKKDLENIYQKVYGKNLPEEKSFYISENKACYLENDNFYCGEGETYMYSLTAESSIYRLLNKAILKRNDDITITDYYLRVSNNKCYQSNNNDEEITACSNELAKNDDITIDSEFVMKYGAIYEHTYKQDKNGNHYWYKSQLKS